MNYKLLNHFLTNSLIQIVVSIITNRYTTTTASDHNPNYPSQVSSSVPT